MAAGRLQRKAQEQQKQIREKQGVDEAREDGGPGRSQMRAGLRSLNSVSVFL